jgi:hypothetical protein
MKVVIIEDEDNAVSPKRQDPTTLGAQTYSRRPDS